MSLNLLPLMSWTNQNFIRFHEKEIWLKDQTMKNSNERILFSPKEMGGCNSRGGWRVHKNQKSGGGV